MSDCPVFHWLGLWLCKLQMFLPVPCSFYSIKRSEEWQHELSAKITAAKTTGTNTAFHGEQKGFLYTLYYIRGSISLLSSGGLISRVGTCTQKHFGAKSHQVDVIGGVWNPRLRRDVIISLWRWLKCTSSVIYTNTVPKGSVDSKSSRRVMQSNGCCREAGNTHWNISVLKIYFFHVHKWAHCVNACACVCVCVRTKVFVCVYKCVLFQMFLLALLAAAFTRPRKHWFWRDNTFLRNAEGSAGPMFRAHKSIAPGAGGCVNVRPMEGPLPVGGAGEVPIPTRRCATLGGPYIRQRLRQAQGICELSTSNRYALITDLFFCINSKKGLWSLLFFFCSSSCYSFEAIVIPLLKVSWFKRDKGNFLAATWMTGVPFLPPPSR